MVKKLMIWDGFGKGVFRITREKVFRKEMWARKGGDRLEEIVNTGLVYFDDGIGLVYFDDGEGWMCSGKTGDMDWGLEEVK